MRYSIFAACVVLAGLTVGLALAVSPWWWLAAAPLVALASLGLYDVAIQRRHSVLRNYPVIARLRYVIEAFRPELRQYLFASDKAETPFNRDQRTLVYQRAKDIEDRAPFGTKYDVYAAGYAFMTHSLAAKPRAGTAPRVAVGGDQCDRPYAASLLNISAMSFGALSPNAIMALNQGAARGGFFHDTGEGSISRYHRCGGDLVWQLGTGYFGARRSDGRFCDDTFRDTAADDCVKMIEIKLSQGAKPGHGGVLPGEKVSADIAEARGVPVGRDVLSPPSHPEFSTPVEMMVFMARVRALAGGKPVGFKLCLGHDWEFAAMAKAMRATGLYPDFIVVDGAEGGTGAAPLEFSDHVGVPLAEGLAFAHNILVGAGLRDRIRLGASGKVVTGFDILRLISLGADWCNAARAFMVSVGCIQSLTCHTNRCPVGVATTDPWRARALDVADKADRVYHFHRNTIAELMDVTGAAGLDHPGQIRRDMVFRRRGDSRVVSSAERFDWLDAGELLAGSGHERYRRAWARAQAHSFRPAL
ncbi:glutamate synthase domain-containing protein 2 [Rhodothalassium salexigens DSM 2132]|uniref:Glutamate synthase domain-containing protein 2 n=1 Tax=Rhodothalassium salexigens DSM 2132 TaxID=1188247 RepID=A0A4R2PQN8_RHOSA|nr:FMN-binding glutamate synthase family protein [Rhodothalassium salexigens]MBB4210927.1 glutamate synthase domain-containing protein 2 [Rhodothalassium salexigens DSM 2132]MBK1639468.1 FMN-binding glutamate synthase family protein [Rhodothalassium salexigens DSM 2132]TCP36415.1 glutamate synthase domain-containing protein 2 [Rhodothalassium salexigens DSM 2132]